MLNIGSLVVPGRGRPRQLGTANVDVAVEAAVAVAVWQLIVISSRYGSSMSWPPYMADHPYWISHARPTPIESLSEQILYANHASDLFISGTIYFRNWTWGAISESIVHTYKRCRTNDGYRSLWWWRVIHKYGFLTSYIN